MEHTVFLSWQSDLPETRSVVRWALERAVKSLNRGGTLEQALRVDQDTENVAGWPDIAATLLDKIEKCELFVADLTPINGPESDCRLTPNPNVMLELGYALATGMGRTRIVCVVNDAYLPYGDLSELPFDVRGSRPLVFSLEDPGTRGAEKGREDSVRAAAREKLARDLERALGDALGAVEAERASRVLGVTPHLAADGQGNFQVVLDLKTTVPFQVTYMINEPAGQVLSGLMTAPQPVDPKGIKRVRFPKQTLKPLTQGNDIYVLSGEVAHVATDKRPVPEFHRFEVHYRFGGAIWHEISRRNPPSH